MEIVHRIYCNIGPQNLHVGVRILSQKERNTVRNYILPKSVIGPSRFFCIFFFTTIKHIFTPFLITVMQKILFF